MKFLLNISTIIDYIVTRSKRLYSAISDIEGMADPLVKEVYQLLFF